MLITHVNLVQHSLFGTSLILIIIIIIIMIIIISLSRCRNHYERWRSWFSTHSCLQCFICSRRYKHVSACWDYSCSSAQIYLYLDCPQFPRDHNIFNSLKLSSPSMVLFIGFLSVPALFSTSSFVTWSVQEMCSIPL